jgi:hypothetical protein
MMLVSKPLNGNNYLTRSRAMMISLNAKSKLGFKMEPLPCCLKQTSQMSMLHGKGAMI